MIKLRDLIIEGKPRAGDYLKVVTGEVGQINKWENKNNLPFFVTATCAFSRFDDPERISAGEYTFLNKDGGAIGLLSTTRLVYAGDNMELNKAFIEVLFEKENGKPARSD